MLLSVIEDGGPEDIACESDLMFGSIQDLLTLESEDEIKIISSVQPVVSDQIQDQPERQTTKTDSHLVGRPNDTEAVAQVASIPSVQVVAGMQINATQA